MSRRRRISSRAHMGCLIVMIVMCVGIWMALPMLGFCRHILPGHRMLSLVLLGSALCAIVLLFIGSGILDHIEESRRRLGVLVIFGSLTVLAVGDGIVVSSGMHLPGWLWAMPPVLFAGALWAIFLTGRWLIRRSDAKFAAELRAREAKDAAGDGQRGVGK